MISLIQTSSVQAVDAMSASEEKVHEGMARTTQSLLLFKKIELSVTDTVAEIHSVSEAISKIELLTENVNYSSVHVYRLSEKAMVFATDTSAATEEQVATTEEVTSNAQSLASLAENLQSNVNHFKL